MNECRQQALNAYNVLAILQGVYLNLSGPEIKGKEQWVRLMANVVSLDDERKEASLQLLESLFSTKSEIKATKLTVLTLFETILGMEKT